MENQPKDAPGKQATPNQNSSAPPAAATPPPQQEQSQAGNANAPFDPLGEAAIQKQTRPVVVNTQQLSEMIPEPTFQAPPISNEPDPLSVPSGSSKPQSAPADNNFSPSQSTHSDGGAWKGGGGYDGPPRGGGSGYGGGSSYQRPKERQPVVLPMADMSPEERSQASDNAAKAFMQAYKLLHTGMNAVLSVSQFKQYRMERKGLLNLHTPLIPTRAGNLVTIKTYLDEYNEKVKEAFTVDPEFEEEVMPVLQRVLAKHGIGMSDEARLAMLVGQDLGIKVIGKGIPMWQEKNVQLDFLKDITKAWQEGRQPQAQAAPAPTMTHEAPPPPPPAPPPPPQQEYRQGYADQRGPTSYAQNDAINEYGTEGLHAGEGIQRRWGNKKLLQKASQISKKYQKNPARKVAGKKK